MLRKNKEINAALQGVLAVGCWIVSWVVAYYVIFPDFEAVYAYSLMTGWWFTAFVAAKLRLKASSAIYMFLAYWPMFALSWAFESEIFYKEVRSLPFGGIVLIVAVQGLIFCSPVLFNRVMDVFFEKFIGWWRASG